jgi:hypothetical protein
MSKMELLKFTPHFLEQYSYYAFFSNCVISIKTNQSRMDHKFHHIDLASKDQAWPHQIQPIESRPHMQKHAVGHT